MGKIKVICAALLLCVATSTKHNSYTLEKLEINDIISENYYYFMKKGARSKGYYINEKQICIGVKEA